MDRTSTYHRQSFEAPGQEARELTEAELGLVSGGNSLQYVQAVVSYSAAQMASGNLVKASD
jgi:hypothetical protein